MFDQIVFSRNLRSVKGAEMFLRFFNLSLLAVLLLSCNSADEPKNVTFNIVITGSDTEQKLVSEIAQIFTHSNQTVNFTVNGGGSSTGIQALLEGQTDLANSSREISSKEMTIAQQKGVQPIPIVFALDAVAIITNPKLGVDSLSLLELRSIFTGEAKNWNEFGGPDLPINLYGREEKSGTYAYFKNRIMGHEYGSSLTHLATNREIVDAVIDDLGGIGYVGAGFLMDAKGKPNTEIWAMYIYIEGDRAYSPYEIEAVKSGYYPMTRPLYQYVNGIPEGKVDDFVKFELSDQGQQLVRELGFFPINEMHRHINKENKIGVGV